MLEETTQETTEELNNEQEVVAEQEEKSITPTVDYNWEQARQLMQMQKARIEELESQAVKKPPERDELEELDPDDYVTVSKANILAERKAKEVAEKAVREYARNQAVSMDETRMRSAESDYDYVIENFAVPLLRNNAALQYYVRESQTPAETAYAIAKTSAEYKAQMAKKDGAQKAERIQRNSSRPSPGVTLGPTKVSGDPSAGKSKEEIWKEAQGYARKA